MAIDKANGVSCISGLQPIGGADQATGLLRAPTPMKIERGHILWLFESSKARISMRYPGPWGRWADLSDEVLDL